MKVFSLKKMIAIIAILQLFGCSEQTVSTSKLANEVATVGIQVKGGKRILKVNEQVSLPISVVNNGNAAIPSKGHPNGGFTVFATYHWLKLSGEVSVWDGLRTSLGEDIKVGHSLDLVLALKAPAEPGKYMLIVDLVQEGALWFADTGSQTATMVYTIQ